MNHSFFTFGPEDSFISQTHAGLNYRNIPKSLKSLLRSEGLGQIYHVSLGPDEDSWVCSYRNSQGQVETAHGASIPRALESFLSSISPSPHLKVSFGPRHSTLESSRSFFASSPSGFRWSHLPDSLEDTLQSWLTPCGWKVGPPRIVVLGAGGAYFALSEHGDCDYSFEIDGGDFSALWQETVDEWEEESDFDWDDVDYISFNPSEANQFIAIRSSGSWAGSIDDSNAEALQSFATSYFPNSEPGWKPQEASEFPPRSDSAKGQGQPNSIPEHCKPNAVLQAHYRTWANSTATMITQALAVRNKHISEKLDMRDRKRVDAASNNSFTENTLSPRLLSGFPYLPEALTTCTLLHCVSHKSNEDGIRACKHDVERLFRASGLYNLEWLRKERLRWHPDRFGPLCEEEWREQGRRLAEEMWKVIDELIGELLASRE
ncbi:hypothetical protein GQ43DRAFT_476097 [Delitschia confertaspora ATCC 74209]|uniref:Uncharacterized protein n=1 Tax=Delitschia confertaspora ATCC 74209 TaxID=1513339 RepID=A0A9P4MN22_9PLEO|nr:hypothetical protein GQ43DRAFT_476097 [Delitschia confertaspora ATCC 74209]